MLRVGRFCHALVYGNQVFPRICRSPKGVFTKLRLWSVTRAKNEFFVQMDCLCLSAISVELQKLQGRKLL
jgi:hypothetical protein